MAGYLVKHRDKFTFALYVRGTVESLSQAGNLRAEIWTRHLPNMKQGCQPSKRVLFTRIVYRYCCWVLGGFFSHIEFTYIQH
jgi:hypothetical protein